MELRWEHSRCDTSALRLGVVPSVPRGVLECIGASQSWSSTYGRGLIKIRMQCSICCANGEVSMFEVGGSLFQN